MLFKILGMLAAILTTASFIPQAVKTIKTKDTSGISFGMYSMFTMGVLFWLSYGLFIKDIAIIVANIVTFILAFIILMYKIGNMKKGEKKEY